MPGKLPSQFTQFNAQFLKGVDDQFWNYQNSNFSFLELSHRSKYYADINIKAIEMVATYFKVPLTEYEVLFLWNGVQYSAIPWNLLKLVNNRCIYIVNDAESQMAYQEAFKLNQKAIRIDNAKNREGIVKQKFEAGEVYYTFYNKINKEKAETHEELTALPNEILVANLNYCAHYESVDVSKHGIVFFETGRGFSLPGLCITFVRKNIMRNQLPNCPDLMDFQCLAKMKSIVNTPFTLCPFIIAHQIQQFVIQNQTHLSTKIQLREIKQAYQEELRKIVKVIETEAPGLLIIDHPSEKIKSSILENMIALEPNLYLILIQVENKGQEKIFAESFIQ